MGRGKAVPVGIRLQDGDGALLTDQLTEGAKIVAEGTAIDVDPAEHLSL
jgi:hypothetical protein